MNWDNSFQTELDYKKLGGAAVGFDKYKILLIKNY
jgi:hypothetical protein